MSLYKFITSIFINFPYVKNGHTVFHLFVSLHEIVLCVGFKVLEIPLLRKLLGDTRVVFKNSKEPREVTLSGYRYKIKYYDSYAVFERFADVKWLRSKVARLYKVSSPEDSELYTGLFERPGPEEEIEPTTAQIIIHAKRLYEPKVVVPEKIREI